MKKIILLLIGMNFIISLHAEEKVLKSALAGSWYTDDPVKLKAELEGFLKNAKQKPMDKVIALILPHAGYRFSGQTAAYGIKALKKKYKRFIIIGPYHRVGMMNILSIPDVTYYQTPLGKVPLDQELIAKLKKHNIFRTIPQVHKTEHSVQMEIPLLQVKQKDFTIVPIVVGMCDEYTIKKAGEVIRGMMDEETLLIASSDFTHYGRNYGFVPFKKNIPENIKKIDYQAFDKIKNLNLPGFSKFMDDTGATICGRMSISILLATLPKDTGVHELKYTTSGELTKDYTNSVSYFSIAFTGKWNKKKLKSGKNDKNFLTKEDKQNLLKLARDSLSLYLKNKKTPTPADFGVKVSDCMKAKRAAFVTLKKGGHLRGCIGEIFPRQELYKSVIANAVNAGVNDRRFQPVTQDELKNIDFEISALTPPKQVDSYKKIRIGTDGMVLKKGWNSAVFLPQVAPEQGWDLSTTLSYLSRKAGLPANGWQNGCTWLTFQAEVFGEKTH